MENSEKLTFNKSAETPATLNASQQLPHKHFSAEVADLEQAADVIKARLEPKPPNFVQKALRIVTYPVAVIATVFFGHIEVRKGIETLMGKNGHLEGMSNLADNLKKVRGDVKKIAETMQAHEWEKADFVRDFLGVGAMKKDAGFFSRLASKAHVDVKAFKVLPTERQAQVVFQAAAALSLTTALGLTLSDNKNFLSWFTGKDKDKTHTVAAHPGQERLFQQVQRDSLGNAATVA